METHARRKRWMDSFENDKEGVDGGKSWQWIVSGDLKGCTEGLICKAQEQAIRITQSFILIRMLNLHSVECVEENKKLLASGK